jgi:hypothetical protein
MHLMHGHGFRAASAMGWLRLACPGTCFSPSQADYLHFLDPSRPSLEEPPTLGRDAAFRRRVYRAWRLYQDWRRLKPPARPESPHHFPFFAAARRPSSGFACPLLGNADPGPGGSSVRPSPHAGPDVEAGEAPVPSPASPRRRDAAAGSSGLSDSDARVLQGGGVDASGGWQPPPACASAGERVLSYPGAGGLRAEPPRMVNSMACGVPGDPSRS